LSERAGEGGEDSRLEKGKRQRRTRRNFRGGGFFGNRKIKKFHEKKKSTKVMGVRKKDIRLLKSDHKGKWSHAK